MTTKTVKRPIVEFYATSPRLVHACRHAAKHNKSLARLAEVQELRHAATPHGVGRQASDIAVVVLSHADDDHCALIDSRAEPVVARAFHLLFTGPATHPDQVAQWMRSTNIRSANRLHVVKVEDMEAPEVSQLLGRVCFALGRDGNRGRIIDAYLVGDRLFVLGPKHRALDIPLDSLGALRGRLDRRSEISRSIRTGHSSTGRTWMSTWAGPSFCKRSTRPSSARPSSGAPASTNGMERPSGVSARRRVSSSRGSRGSPSASSAASSRGRAGPRPRRSPRWQRLTASTRTPTWRG